MRSPKFCPEADHDEACLCDVIITQPVVINAELFLGSLWTELTNSVLGEDVDMLTHMRTMIAAVDELRPEPTSTPTPLRLTRDIVKDYLDDGGSIEDVEDNLGIHFDTAIAALLNGRPSALRELSQEQWVQIQDSYRFAERRPDLDHKTLSVELSRHQRNTIHNIFNRSTK